MVGYSLGVYPAIVGFVQWKRDPVFFRLVSFSVSFLTHSLSLSLVRYPFVSISRLFTLVFRLPDPPYNAVAANVQKCFCCWCWPVRMDRIISFSSNERETTTAHRFIFFFSFVSSFPSLFPSILCLRWTCKRFRWPVSGNGMLPFSLRQQTNFERTGIIIFFCLFIHITHLILRLSSNAFRMHLENIPNSLS